MIKKTRVIKSTRIGWFYRGDFPEDKTIQQQIAQLTTKITPNKRDQNQLSDVNDSVQKDELIAIIVHGTMIVTAVTTEFPGKIIRFLVENGEAVDYGKPLITIEPVSQ